MPELLPGPAGPPPASPSPLAQSQPEAAPRCAAPKTAPLAELPCSDRGSFTVVLARTLRKVELAAGREAAERERLHEARRQELMALRRSGRRLPVDPQRAWERELKQASAKNRAAQERLLVERDRALSRLESCAGAPVGFVRQLRAEVYPACRESLLAEWADRPPAGMDGEGYAAARGLVIAARLDRLRFVMSPLRGSFDDGRLRSFIQKTVLPWQERELSRLKTWDQAIDALAPDSYGNLMALQARARAAERLLSAHREADITRPMKKDVESRRKYYTAIDDVSRPLVSDLAQTRRALLTLSERRGVIWHESLERRRYSGFVEQQIPVHAELVLPHLPDPADDAPEAVWLARRLPSDASERLLPPAELAAVSGLAALVARGLPGTLRAHFDAHPPDSEQDYLLGHARIRLGLLYPSPEQFARARAHLEKAAPHPDREFLMALAAVLERYPSSVKPPPDEVFAPLTRIAARIRGVDEVRTPEELAWALAALDLGVLELHWRGVQSPLTMSSAATAALKHHAYRPCPEAGGVFYHPLSLGFKDSPPNCQPHEAWRAWLGH